MIDRITEQPFCQTRVMCRAVDNLELLLSQPNESVDLIYCDILYGTGRNFGEYQDLKPIRSEIESHYLPRIIVMKRVLKQNGTIYIHTGVNTSHWIRCLMDDVFGELDTYRAEKISSYLGSIGQAFITMTDFSKLDKLNVSENDKVISVTNGNAVYAH